MIAVDTNVLVYAHREEMPLHALALERLRALVEGSTPWALPTFCIGEFVRLVTHPRVFHPPTDLETALAFLEQVLGSPSPGRKRFTSTKPINNANVVTASK